MGLLFNYRFVLSYEVYRVKRLFPKWYVLHDALSLRE
ncbi:hypothetical protein PATA110615_26260 [Paenibacillus taichungensis]